MAALLNNYSPEVNSKGGTLSWNNTKTMPKNNARATPEKCQNNARTV
ncbi:hypothetical protein IJG78_03475 [Candidatus Saccharibacteria bacterium]|nr:hypothetical protein [Candidatus Saccharibacteria bacterium]